MSIDGVIRFIWRTRQKCVIHIFCDADENKEEMISHTDTWVKEIRLTRSGHFYKRLKCHFFHSLQILIIILVGWMDHHHHNNHLCISQSTDMTSFSLLWFWCRTRNRLCPNLILTSFVTVTKLFSSFSQKWVKSETKVFH